MLVYGSVLTTDQGLMRLELDTRIDGRQDVRVVSQKKTISMIQAMSLRHRTESPPGQGFQYPFHFDIESWLEQRNANRPDREALAYKTNFSGLPPSLHHEILTTPDGVQRPRAAARVTYHITARVLRGSKTMSKVIQPILISLPACPAPPVCLADFQEEYREEQRCLLRGSVFRKPGVLSMTVREPPALTLRRDARHVVVHIPIRLQMEQLKQDAGLANASGVEAEISWQMRISTFVSLREKKGPVSLKEATTSPTSGHVRSAFKIRHSRMTWDKWRLDVSTTAEDRVVSRSEQTLAILLPRSELLTPTFWTPYLGRRYSVWLQLKVVKPGTAAVEVEVPIQVGVDTGSAKAYNDDLTMQRCRDSSLMIDGIHAPELLPRYECLE